MVASVEIDGTGRREGKPVLYHWPWYWHIPRLVPWLLLMLAIVLRGANRDRRALLIFLPPLALSLLGRRAAMLLGMPSLSVNEFGVIFGSLVVGTALLWLNADTLARFHGGMRLALSLGFLLLGILATGLSRDSTLSGEAATLLPLSLFPGVILLMILAATRRLVRRCYDPARFLLWTAICSALFSVAGMTVLANMPMLSQEFGSTGREILFTGLALGLCLYAIDLPYVLLMFGSPFFRQRFRLWLGARPISQPHEPIPRL